MSGFGATKFLLIFGGTVAGALIIHAAVCLPINAVGVQLVFDRFLEMSRTAVIVLGEACCAVIIASQTGEELEPLHDGPVPTA